MYLFRPETYDLTPKNAGTELMVERRDGVKGKRLEGLGPAAQKLCDMYVRQRCIRTYTKRMIKKMSAVGNSLGLVIERPILELLNITKETLLEIKTDGVGLTIRPVRTKRDRILAAADELMDAHEETFRKLAK